MINPDDLGVDVKTGVAGLCGGFFALLVMRELTAKQAFVSITGGFVAATYCTNLVMHLLSIPSEFAGGVGFAIGVFGLAIIGKVLKKPMADISEAEFDEMDAVNNKAAFFFLKEAGLHLNDGGKICTLVTSLLGAFTPFYASYAGTKAPVEHYTRAAAKEFGARGISVTAVGPGPMDTPFFYGQESAEAQAYHKSAAALSPSSKTGLTDIEDVVPFVRHLVSDGWWITGQTILINGGYTTK